MEKHTVLIVDDHEEWCAVLKTQIEQYPIFEVISPAFNGEEAIRYIKQFKPDIIILDLILPIYDGLYIIEYVRNRIKDYKPYIYVLSAIGADKTNRVMQHLDIDYYSIKPINTNVVAFNLFKLIDKVGIQGLNQYEPLLPNIHREIDEHLMKLGAPFHLLSTRCTQTLFRTCVDDEVKIKNLSMLYVIVASKMEATPSSIEKNVRSTIKVIRQKSTSYFRECFPYGDKKLTNAEFINGSVYIIRRKLEETFGDRIFAQERAGGL